MVNHSTYLIKLSDKKNFYQPYEAQYLLKSKLLSIVCCMNYNDIIGLNGI